jgi:hypothetical protein
MVASSSGFLAIEAFGVYILVLLGILAVSRLQKGWYREIHRLRG